MAKLTSRLKNAWNVFREREPTSRYSQYVGAIGQSPYDSYLSIWGAADVVGSIYNQIAVDCSSLNVLHVRLDSERRYSETIYDGLNEVLSLSANKDQTGRMFIRDIVISMLDEGVIAVVPFCVDKDPYNTDSFEVLEARVARIVSWYPDHVLVEIYDEDRGIKVQKMVEKRTTVILENPFFQIMNTPNSIKQRLLRILGLLERSNTAAASDSLDLIIQLPYSVKSSAKKNIADERLKDIENQLINSPRGIAYVDGTEKIIQLNRPLENNLWEQAKDLTKQMYNAFGLTEEVFNGTADEKVMLNYMSKTIEPIMSAIVEEMERKWLSQTARSQLQAIRFFRDPFKLVPVAQLAETVDKLTRNEVVSSNECRSFMGLKPSKDPKADELRNSNLNHPEEKSTVDITIPDGEEDVENMVNVSNTTLEDFI